MDYGLIGVVISAVGVIGIVPLIYNNIKKKKEIIEESNDCLEHNKLNDKYQREYFLFIEELFKNIDFYMYSNSKRLIHIIKTYSIYLTSSQFKYVFLSLVKERKLFKNRFKILVLSNHPFLLILKKYIIKLILNDIEELHDYIKDDEKTMDSTFSTERKFELFLSELSNDIIEANKIAMAKIFYLHSNAGDGKTTILNFIYDSLRKKSRNIYFIDSISISNNFEKLHEKIKNILKIKTMTRKILIIDGLNEISNNSNEIGKLIIQINKLNKRHRILISTRTLHFKKHLSNLGISYDYFIKYYDFLGGFKDFDKYRRNLIINKYCEYYSKTREEIGLIENYIFSQMLLVKIFFKVNTNSSEIINNRTKLFSKYIQFLIDKFNDKDDLVIDSYDLFSVVDTIVKIYIDEKKTVKYSRVIELLDQKKIQILDFLIKEEIIFRTDDNWFSETTDKELLFNFDDLRDYFIAHSLQRIEPTSFISEYQDILNRYPEIMEGTFEHLMNYCNNEGNVEKLDQLLYINNDFIPLEYKMRILIKNGIFNDFFEKNISKNNFYIYSTEIKNYVLNAMLEAKKIPEESRIHSIVKSNIRELQLLENYFDYNNNLNTVILILKKIKNESSKYNKEDVILFLNLLLSPRDNHDEFQELFDYIVIFFNLRRGDKNDE